MKVTLSESSGVPFWQQVRDQLLEHIASGSLPAGAPLPSIRELAAETLVSVITVKKAYEELEHAGLVRSHQGRGTFVADGAVERVRAEVEGAIDVLLRGVVARAAAAGVTREQLQARFVTAADEAYGRRGG